MGQLTKDEIFGKDDMITEVVEVPEWGGSVTVSVMSSKNRDLYEAGKWKQVGKKIVPNLECQTAKLLSLTIINDDGSMMFSQADIGQLSTKSNIALERVSKVALRLNSLTDESVEDTIKN